MILITETGAGLSNALSYCSVADANAYFINRGNDAWDAMTDDAKSTAIVRGCDYITQTYRGRWSGYRVSTVQALDWPRFMVPRIDTVNFMGVASFYLPTVIPAELIAANAEAAMRSSLVDMLEDQDTPTIQETVGPISVHKAIGASQFKRYPVIDRLIQTFLLNGNGFRITRS